MLKKRALSVLFILICSAVNVFGQILHTEVFSIILDSTRFSKGSIVPDFKFQNQKENLIEFENTADISFRFKKSALTFANKIELSKYGEDVLLSGGFLYIEYRKLLEKKMVLEPFSQINWSDARGLQFKYAGGVNFRYRIYTSKKIGFFTGIGPFYEFERWNFKGVPDERLPTNLRTIDREHVKLGSYISFKWFTDFNIDIDISLYHQSTFDEIITAPRLASSTSVTYKFTEHIGLILRYQNIYDYQTVVPIEKLFNKLICTIEVNF